MRHATDPVAFLQALQSEPQRYDFYQTLRRLDALHPASPRWGEARRPGDEPVRLGQEADLAFAPAALTALEPAEGTRPPRLKVALFGLLGPNGPLPLHITEYVRARLRHEPSDPTLARFLDLFNHRFLALFYRAWAQAQPHVNRDRPGQDRFAIYIGSFIGTSAASPRVRDAVPDVARMAFAGILMRQPRSAGGLRTILTRYFRVPVAIEEYVGGWLSVEESERSVLGRRSAGLGVDAIAGGRVWDRQHMCRIRLGPLSIEGYRSFLPGGSGLQALTDWLRFYLNDELRPQIRLVLRAADVPRLELGRAGAAGAAGRLGWTAWLGRRTAGRDADDLCLDGERLARRALARQTLTRQGHGT